MLTFSYLIAYSFRANILSRYKNATGKKQLNIYFKVKWCCLYHAKYYLNKQTPKLDSLKVAKFKILFGY